MTDVARSRDPHGIHVVLRQLDEPNAGRTHDILLSLPLRPSGLASEFFAACGHATTVGAALSPPKTIGSIVAVRFAMTSGGNCTPIRFARVKTRSKTMPDPSGPRITIYARGAKNLASAIGDFVKASLDGLFWILVASARRCDGLSRRRAIWWGVQAVLKAGGVIMAGALPLPPGEDKHHITILYNAAGKEVIAIGYHDVTTDDKGREIHHLTHETIGACGWHGVEPPSCSNAKIR